MTSDPVARFLALRAAKVERRARLRPMTSGEMLDSALAVSRNLGIKILSVSLIPTLFCVAALEFVGGYVLPELEFTHNPTSTSGQVAETVFAVAMAIFIGGPIFLLGATYAGSVVIKLTSHYLLGESAEVDVAESAVRGRLGTLFLCGLRELAICFGCLLVSGALLLASGPLADATQSDSVIAGVAALIGGGAFLVGIIAVFVLFARRAIMFPVVIIEGVGLKQATARMKKLMKSSKYQQNGAGVVGSMYAISILTYFVIYAGVSTVVAMFDLEGHLQDWANHSVLEPLLTAALGLVPALFAMWALLPFWAVTLTVLYYERRIRVEGFDIEQLAGEVGRDGRTNRFNV